MSTGGFVASSSCLPTVHTSGQRMAGIGGETALSHSHHCTHTSRSENSKVSQHKSWIFVSIKANVIYYNNLLKVSILYFEYIGSQIQLHSYITPIVLRSTSNQS